MPTASLQIGPERGTSSTPTMARTGSHSRCGREAPSGLPQQSLNLSYCEQIALPPETYNPTDTASSRPRELIKARERTL
jgi:hypothetical protein